MDKRRFDDYRDEVTVLIVDDAVSIRTQLRALLGNEGIKDARILEASNGDDALELFREEEPDLILLDVMLPETPGWIIGPRMLEEQPDANIALLTGLDPGHERVRELISSGVVEVLHKPIREKELRNLLVLMASRWKPGEEGRFFGQASA